MGEVAMAKSEFVKYVAKRLAQHGFAQRSGTFALRGDACVRVVNVQRSSGRPRVAINLGIYLRELGRKLGDADDWIPGVIDCHWRARLGEEGVGDAGVERWWDVSDPNATEEGARDAIEQLERFALPTMHRLSHDGALVGYWESGRSDGLTAIECARYLALLRTGPTGLPEDRRAQRRQFRASSLPAHQEYETWQAEHDDSVEVHASSSH
jgi:hypothetical protein